MKKRLRRPPYGPFRRDALYSPSSLLAARWQTLSCLRLENYCRKLLIRENQCRPHRGKIVYPPAPHAFLHPRLTRRRLHVARKIGELGGRVSARALSWALPLWIRWPGMLHLVGEYADKDLEPAYRSMRSQRWPSFAAVPNVP